MKDLKRMRLILIPIIIVIVLPLLVFIIAQQGKNVYKPLPYIGIPEGIDEKGDTIYHTVKPFNFTDQYGKPFGTDSLKGKIYVAQFFFTSCSSICPVMTKNLKKEVFDYYSKRPDFRMVTISIDPKRDTAERLMRFAQKFGINDSKWRFLSPQQDSLYSLLGPNSFMQMTPQAVANSDQITHSPIVDLVDKEGHIRGTYDATNIKELERLRDEINVLMISYERHQ